MTSPTTEGIACGTPCETTDRHLWPLEADEPFCPSIHATAGGGIGMNVDGHVIVMHIRRWHELAKASLAPEPRAERKRTGHPDCRKCHGSGWVYGDELYEADEATRADTMTKYSCDSDECLSLTKSDVDTGGHSLACAKCGALALLPSKDGRADITAVRGWEIADGVVTCPKCSPENGRASE